LILWLATIEPNFLVMFSILTAHAVPKAVTLSLWKESQKFFPNFDLFDFILS